MHLIQATQEPGLSWASFALAELLLARYLVGGGGLEPPTSLLLESEPV